MNSRITARIAEVRTLAEKATPGPWKANRLDAEHIEIDGPYTVATMFHDVRDASLSDIDAAFIAASRELVPTLLKVIEKLIEQRNDALEDTLGEKRFAAWREKCDAEIADLLGKEGK